VRVHFTSAARLLDYVRTQLAAKRALKRCCLIKLPTTSLRASMIEEAAVRRSGDEFVEAALQEVAPIASLGHALMPMAATIRSVCGVELLTSMTGQ